MITAMASTHSGDSALPPIPAPGAALNRRSRWWLLVTFAPGILVLGLIVTWCVVGLRSRSLWKSYQQDLETMRSRVDAADRTRAPLEGESLPGNAFAGYREAWSETRAMSAQDQNLLHEAALRGSAPERDAAAAEILRRHPRIIQRLRDAARCDSWEPGFRWEQGVEQQLAWCGDLRRLSRIVALHARLLRSAGDLDASLDALASGLQLGADVGRSGSMIPWLVGAAIRGIVLSECAQLAGDPRLTPAGLNRLARLLDRLEADVRPVADALEVDRLELGHSLLRYGNGEKAQFMAGDGPDSGGRMDLLRRRHALAWRHAWSWRLTFVALDSALGRLAATTREVRDLPWADAATRIGSLRAELRKDPLAELLLVDYAGVSSTERSDLARIRLLRALCAERASQGPVTPLPLDPHSRKPIHRREEGSRVVFWAEWEDGDNGGTGTFYDMERTSPDIVLEWKR